MKLTKKQIEIIRENTPKELKGVNTAYTFQDFGYYQPSQANWSYQVGYIKYKGVPILVVKQFGQII